MFTANGARPAQNNYLLDGIDNNTNDVDFLASVSFVIKPPVDAIAEFNLQTSDFSAEFGRAGGAVLNATLKSGTNAFHGSLWEFLRNDKLDAADFFQNANGTKKGDFRQNQFGATAGGHIVRNKTFWFGDYEGTRIRQAVPRQRLFPRRWNATVDSQISLTWSLCKQALIRMRWAGLFRPARFSTPPLRKHFPTGSSSGSRLQEINIPANRLDPTAVKFLSLYPAPTQAGLLNNYSVNRKNTTDTNSFDVRLDQYFSDKDQAFLRYSYSHSPSEFPGPFTGYADGGGFANGDQTADTQGAALSYTHSFTDRWSMKCGQDSTASTRFASNRMARTPATFPHSSEFREFCRPRAMAACRTSRSEI